MFEPSIEPSIEGSMFEPSIERAIESSMFEPSIERAIEGSMFEPSIERAIEGSMLDSMQRLLGTGAHTRSLSVHSRPSSNRFPPMTYELQYVFYVVTVMR